MVRKNSVVMLGTAIAASLTMTGVMTSAAMAESVVRGHEGTLLSQSETGGVETIVRGEVLEMVGNRVRIRNLDTGEESFYRMTESQQIDAGLYESMLVELVVVEDEVISVMAWEEEEEMVTETMIEEEMVEETMVEETMVEETVVEETVVETTVVEEEMVETTTVREEVAPISNPAPVPALW
jgi:hypothetical protein